MLPNYVLEGLKSVILQIADRSPLITPATDHAPEIRRHLTYGSLVRQLLDEGFDREQIQKAVSHLCAAGQLTLNARAESLEIHRIRRTADESAQAPAFARENPNADL